MIVAEGSEAPDFTLPNQFGQSVALSEFRGSGVVLVFFPLAFSGVCGAELAALRDELPLFTARGAAVLGVSVDSKATLRAFGDGERIDFSLLSDFWPHGAVAEQYGVFRSDLGVAGRHSFFIDGNGVVRATLVAEMGAARPQLEYRRLLETIAP